MKTLLSLLAALSGLAYAATPPDSGTVPEGLAPSEWADIRAAYEAGRHAPQRQEGGHLVARNPGQQWSADFDGKGFTVTPDHGGWIWGLELTGYGDRKLSAASHSQLRHEGGKIICQRDDNLTEWFVNDTRGLEQGWDIQQRPERADPAAPLQLHLSTRGSIRPKVSGSGDNVSFLQESGGSALTYGGLKAWDADGQKLPVRFEQAEGSGIRIAVDDRSARYPITIDPIAQQTFLQASNKGYGDNFGAAVAVSGDTVVVGAHDEDSAAAGVNGDQTSTGAPGSGAAYIFVRSGTGWTQQAYLKASNTKVSARFGFAVAVSGDTVVVGSMFENSAATGVDGDQTSTGAPGSGAAYVFTRSGTAWSQQAYLKASNTEAHDVFGISVAVSGDTVVVGALREGSNATGVNGDQSNNSVYSAGAAYVFTRNGTAWTQQAYLKASNTDTWDAFGESVAVSGDTVVVAAKAEDSSATGVNGDQASNGASDSGAAYVFSRSGTTWTQQAYLKASNTGAFDWFGQSVAVSGDTVVVGAPFEASIATGVNGDQTNDSAPKAGAAYVFIRSGTTWTQQAYLKASNTAINDIYWGSLDYFGESVAISGDMVVVGAYQEDSNATGVNGDQTNNNAGESGAAYAFSRNGTTWTQQAYLKASNTQVTAQFGSAVAVSGETVVVGAPTQDHIYGDDVGAAHITDLFTGPEIFIHQAETNVTSGGTKSFGTVVVGSDAEVLFDLLNLGVGTLNLTGTPKVEVTGSSDFTVTAQPASPIAASGGTTSFKVRFAPTSDGPKSVTLSIPNNDADEAPYLIHLTGTGYAGVDLTWTASSSIVWDVANAPNWVHNGTSTSAPFLNGDKVTFNDSTAATVNTVSIAETVSPGSITVDASENYTFSGAAIDGAATLTKSGTGTLTLTNQNTNSGTVTINGGTLSVGDGGASGNLGTGPIALSGGQLLANRSGDVALPNPISGTGSIGKLGPGSLILSGTTAYSGPVTLAAGPIAAGRSNLFPGGVIIAAGASLDFKGFHPGGFLTISGSGANGEGAILNSGSPMLLPGTHQLGSDAAVGGGFGIKSSGPSNPWEPAQTFPCYLSGNYKLTKVGSGTFSFYKTTLTVKDIVIEGGSILADHFSTINNTYPGTITIHSGGSLDFGNTFFVMDQSVTPATCAKPIVLNGGTISASGGPYHGLSLPGGIELNGPGGTLIAERFISYMTSNGPLPTANISVGGVVSGSGSLIVGGSGIVSLAQAPAYTGDTTILAQPGNGYLRGRLSLAAPGLADTSTVSIADGAFLDLGFSGTDTVRRLFINGVQQQPGVYGQNHISGRILGGGTLTVTEGPAAPPYQLWADSHGIAGADAGADSDGDGIRDGIEFVLGGDPIGPDSNSSALLPVITRNGNTLNFVYRRTDASSANYAMRVEISSNPAANDWAPAPDYFTDPKILVENDAFGPGVDKVTVSIAMAGPKLFARLKVDVP